MHLKRMLKGSLLFLLFLISTLVEEAEGLSSLNLLKNVVTHQEEDAVIFRLEFGKRTRESNSSDTNILIETPHFS